MIIKVINPIQHPQWNQQIAELNDATIFHTSSWTRVLAETYGYQPVYIAAFKSKQLVGYLPLMEIRSIATGRRCVSLPFTDECHPVCTTVEVFEKIWTHALNFGNKVGWKYIELRGEYSVYSEEPIIASYLVHCLDLNTTETDLCKRFRESTYRNITKSKESGVKIECTNSIQALDAFYKLNCLTRKRHGLPPQPKRFFINLYKYIITTDRGFILTAEQKGSVIASAVFLRFNGIVTFKYGASDLRHQHLRANNLILWEAIKRSIQEGNSQFHLGRTETENEGLLQFKRGWGAIEDRINYYKYNMVDQEFSRKKMKIKSSYSLFKIMPLTLLKLFGQILYRHVG